MTVCHKPAIDLMKKFFEKQKVNSTISALDVCCGSGRVTYDLLSLKYDHVDAFDRSENSVKEVKELKSACPNLREVCQCTMEDYSWDKDYDSIWLSWCIGYLEEDQLVKFLKKAKEHLVKPIGQVTRQKPHTSYIFILDTVLGKDDFEFKADGQRVRKRETIELIFVKAGLFVQDFTKEQTLSEGFSPVMMWALK